MLTSNNDELPTSTKGCASSYWVAGRCERGTLLVRLKPQIRAPSASAGFVDGLRLGPSLALRARFSGLPTIVARNLREVRPPLELQLLKRPCHDMAREARGKIC